MYVTYIVCSRQTGRFYTGQTSDLDRRLEEHNRGKSRSLASGKPWDLVFSKEFSTRSEAVKLEMKIKKRGASRFLKDNDITVD